MIVKIAAWNSDGSLVLTMKQIYTEGTRYRHNEFCLFERRIPSFLNMPSLFRGEPPKFLESTFQWYRQLKPFDDLAERIVAPIDLMGNAF